MLQRRSFQLLKIFKWSFHPPICQCNTYSTEHFSRQFHPSLVVNQSINLHSRNLSSELQPPFPPDEDSWFLRKSIETRVRFGLTERPKPYYRLRGLQLAVNLETVRWEDYFKMFQMPDTFHSWFLVIELHLWMLCVRAKAEGVEGECLSKFIVEYMWENAHKRAKKLGSFSSMRDSFTILHEELLAAFVLYDYGLLTSDVALAEAIWFRFLEQNCNDPEKVELLVKHVRKQIQALDQLSRDDLIAKASFPWLPISEKKWE